ncbi:hypothetical protein NVP1111B_56 [Vibrio phage 1.111.B._10N.286.45.E6]|nr:hypothetical protein NVP1111A_56 [Vibrio phage 1.111.A._10N.286.45.E6]AUR88312.1 hypothetical protein NVP1111B_56 [Vibrio phage 1.111.B._10N.286.45.E6]
MRHLARTVTARVVKSVFVRSSMAKANKCRDCWSLGEVNYLGLCAKCAANPAIVSEKLAARQITDEIRKGLPGFYRELRNGKH